MSTLEKHNRSVSIIGTGRTPFTYTVNHPETDGLIEGELFGYAALKVIKDAGANPRDMDFYLCGEASPPNGSNYPTPNVQVVNWFGMKRKGSIHHSEAYCTGYLAIEQTASVVASEKYSCVLTGAAESGGSTPSPADNVESPKHPYERNKMTMEKFLKTTSWLHNRTYTGGLVTDQELIYDDVTEQRVRTRGITAKQINDALNWTCINNRRNAPANSLPLEKWTYESLAEEAGVTLDEYMSSSYNPKMGDYLRAGGAELKCGGAAAAIAYAIEMVSVVVENLGHRPIQVLGIGNVACEATIPHLEVRVTEETVRQVYEPIGMSGDDLDLFYANDFIITSHLMPAETAGYLPYGGGWKYICDGRTTWGGDKPINTNGGRTSFNHVRATSGLTDVYEAHKQLWGECGEHQVRERPKTVMLRGYGSAQNVAAVLLRTIDQQEV